RRVGRWRQQQYERLRLLGGLRKGADCDHGTGGYRASQNHHTRNCPNQRPVHERHPKENYTTSTAKKKSVYEGHGDAESSPLQSAGRVGRPSNFAALQMAARLELAIRRAKGAGDIGCVALIYF